MGVLPLLAALRYQGTISPPLSPPPHGWETEHA